MQKVAVADIIEVVHAFPAVTLMQVMSASFAVDTGTLHRHTANPHEG